MQCKKILNKHTRPFFVALVLLFFFVHASLLLLNLIYVIDKNERDALIRPNLNLDKNESRKEWRNKHDGQTVRQTWQTRVCVKKA